MSPAQASRSLRRSLFLLLAGGALAAGLLLAPAAVAQEEGDEAPAAAAPQPKATAEKAAKVPEKKELRGKEMITKDGVQLAADFYPGAKGKESVPVVLLHSFQGSRKEFSALAPYLQRQGCAVLVPDLRGHGESTVQYTVAGAQGTIKASKFTPANFHAMWNIDMRKLHSVLVKLNDEQQLNLEKLCLVGCEMGASLAMQYAVEDWKWPPKDGKKQGQYVKALVLLSPQRNFHGMDMSGPINAIGRLSFLIMAGKENPGAFREAQTIHKLLARFRSEPDAAKERDTKKKKEGKKTKDAHEEEESKQDLFFIPLKTKLQGSKLLTPGLRTAEYIDSFIQLRLEDQEDFKYHRIKAED